MKTSQVMQGRRRLLSVGVAATAATFLGVSTRSFATVADVEKAIAEFGGGATLNEGLISLNTPEIAENGSSVPVSFSVESPMTADNYVQSVVILAEDNPNAEVITFNFTPMSGVASASTRLRLASTQNVIAVAKLSDGSLHKASNNVKVTIGGCGG